jgi:hypothetical protein
VAIRDTKKRVLVLAIVRMIHVTYSFILIHEEHHFYGIWFGPLANSLCKYYGEKDFTFANKMHFRSFFKETFLWQVLFSLDFVIKNTTI